ncbi:glucose-dependent insulinotropic receptor-like [Acipenser oxyrinchus oxyrinchus]|uniref:Glucose-dependent insulinotropic receptor-like n=1 Tax=Acipenser oxyrinchus oxyrinchus TaxID=40147 RepID=A0AAD8G3D2_ACIOX|nr:glucose-dependent insulinotropic receptor-like [Acipenser oxyrinchus oxyrinchus]
MPTTVYAALHGFLGVLIPLANIVVIVTVYKLMKKKQYKGYILIINLAAADVLVGLMCIVEAIDDVYDGDFDKDITFCLLRICLTITPCIGSILTLMLISLDRYLAVKLPLQYRRIVNTKTLFSVLIALWTFSFVVGHLPLIAPKLQQSNYAGFCGLLYSTKNEYLYVICGTVFIPVFLTLICLHVNLGRMACIQHRQIQRTRVGAVSPLYLRRFKAARTVLIVTICFAWSWGPYYITGIIQATCSDYDLKDLLKDFLFFLGETNSLMNPLIYAFYSKDIRSYLCKLCRG